MSSPLFALALSVSLHAAGASASEAAWVDSTLASLTLRDKVAQMVMPWIPGGEPAARSAEARRARKLVEEGKVGGLIVGKGPARGTAAWLNTLQRRSSLPLLVAADLEWGPGMRLVGATVLPVNMAIAAAGDASLAFEAGRITAREARAAGVHLVFAPVADVNINPSNPVINTRAYGADPGAVAERVAAFIAGARTGGALAAAKHFPGHGDTEADSHLTLPTVSATRGRLEAVELVPFRAAIGAGVSAIMTAHIGVPALEPWGQRRPATLSPPIVTELLRREMGFRGLVVTDGLMMEGVRRGRTVGEVAVEAVRAGADILLMPPDAAEAIDAVVAAVRAGEIDAVRIEESARRVLEAKASVGLHRRRLTDPREWKTVLGAPEHRRWAQEVTERSLTLVRQREGALPLAVAGRRVASIVYDDPRGNDAGAVFNGVLERQGARVTAVRLWRRSTAAELRRAEQAAAGAEVVVFSSYARAVPWKGTMGLPDAVAGLAERLAARGAVVIGFGDPYLLRQVPSAATYLLAWSEEEDAQRAAARALAGESGIAGRLPIPLPPVHLLGEGITLPSRAAGAVADAPAETESVPGATMRRRER